MRHGIFHGEGADQPHADAPLDAAEGGQCAAIHPSVPYGAGRASNFRCDREAGHVGDHERYSPTGRPTTRWNDGAIAPALDAEGTAKCPKCGGPTVVDPACGIGEPVSMLVCVRFDELVEDCPGERRSGKDRRTEPPEGEALSIAELEDCASACKSYPSATCPTAAWVRLGDKCDRIAEQRRAFTRTQEKR